MYCRTTKNWAKKTKKNCRGIFAEGMARGPRQRIFFKKIKNLCRGPILALGKGLLCQGPSLGPSAKTIYKKKFGRKTGSKKIFVEGLV